MGEWVFFVILFAVVTIIVVSIQSAKERDEQIYQQILKSNSKDESLTKLSINIPRESSTPVYTKSVLDIITEYQCYTPVERRKDACHKFINRYGKSTNSLDCLAVGMAYNALGASYRRDAIAYYEIFRCNPVPLPYSTKSQRLTGEWRWRSELATLYEREYEFEKAIKLLKECVDIDEQLHSFNAADYTRIGTLIMKQQGTEAAIAYYTKLKEDGTFARDRKWFNDAFADVLEKHKKGYVYRSRKKKES